VKEQSNLTLADSERLLGYLEGTGKTILPEPHEMLSDVSRLPGLDGQKMSKSNGNLIPLRADDDDIEKKVRTMPTDPARIRLSDAGDPEKCPVWQFHLTYSDADLQQQVQEKCRGAQWGCLECKQPVIDAIIVEQQPIRERARQYEENRDLVRSVIADGTEKAREEVRDTLEVVREAIGLDYL